MPAFLIRFWPYIVGGLVIAGLLVRVWMLSGALEDKRNELARAEAHTQIQNAGIERMRSEGEARQREADLRLAEAQRVNASQQPVIVQLREGAARQRGPAERCEISDTLRNAEGL